MALLLYAVAYWFVGLVELFVLGIEYPKPAYTLADYVLPLIAGWITVTVAVRGYALTQRRSM